ncbi:PREDICTED: protein KRTCAP2 homolog [Amphimedon queenslandica]|uniref:Uncharacterized protein n=1 Tax=Amphimedon queenslandica TaxID=400682 RepID=A0A1X7TTX6_AMPQE|nr:PREDICTED: protein KRTCAP2 homolog [Amphimedon queenslandica]|eukprot:XP_003389796.1 PREDICTED: protein KRTCAP2 homolog [Amphimedon queenslandica]
MGLLPPNYSMFSSLALSVVTIAVMQMFKDQIAVEGNLIRLAIGGFAGSWVFVFLVTALGNFYSLMFPRNPQVNLFPEIIVILFMAVIASAMVHRICATTCLIFSLVALYYLNKITQTSSGPTASGSYVATSQGVGRGKPNPQTPKSQNKKQKR